MDIKKEVVAAFEQGEEKIWVFNEPKRVINKMFFDFDGVLLKESNLHETAYAWMINSIKNNSFDVDALISDGEIELAKILRVEIKGSSPDNKLKYLLAKYRAEDLDLFDLETLHQFWIKFLRKTIQRIYGNQPMSYILEGGDQLLKACNQEMDCYGLTANYIPQADWLMRFIDLGEYFDEILAYPIKDNGNLSKTILLDEFIQKKDFLRTEIGFIGDGVPDVRAGNENGVLSIGVGNTLDNALRLLEVNPDILISSPKMYKELLTLLR